MKMRTLSVGFVNKCQPVFLSILAKSFFLPKPLPFFHARHIGKKRKRVESHCRWGGGTTGGIRLSIKIYGMRRRGSSFFWSFKMEQRAVRCLSDVRPVFVLQKFESLVPTNELLLRAYCLAFGWFSHGPLLSSRIVFSVELREPRIRNLKFWVGVILLFRCHLFC